jgi:hypothetical protein
MWKYMLEGTATDKNMARAHRMLSKATDELWGCVIFIAFPLEQWLRERA